MRIDGKHMRTIWLNEDGWTVSIINQQKLPHVFEIVVLRGLNDAARAIKDMAVRGAPLIGATAAFGLALALRDDPSDAGLKEAYARLHATRPTAINLKWALDEIYRAVHNLVASDRADAAYSRSKEIVEADVDISRRLGEHGASLIRGIAEVNGGKPVNILTHCNAGWLATIDWGTATAPIYLARDEGVPIHVWVDETRPRNQGAALTAYELGHEGIPHTVIVDNAGGHLMQQGQVDLCLVGTDRTAANGDVCNKIGTYLKALAAFDNDVPFYVALPHTTIDWALDRGADIPIEERNAREVIHVSGLTAEGQVQEVQVSAAGSEAANPAFDVTPARLVTSLVTDRGLCAASREGLLSLFPEKKA
ncbi:MAG: S-methyl-5-thioribose-1-phosphate isomerase [Rhodobiaceae bacterium]|nr:S-methyl-5-thioribose-1-phosphate isomerase [Rhodobiaceae bacterium]